VAQITAYNVTGCLFTWYSAERFVGISLDQSADIRRLVVFSLWEENQLFDAHRDQLLDMTTSGAFVSDVVSS
jgi:hypothetical protein